MKLWNNTSQVTFLATSVQHLGIVVHTINADGEYTEDVWLKMATGQTLIVTYNNLNGTSFNGTPVKKMLQLTLVEATRRCSKPLLVKMHDPTILGSQTDDTNSKTSC